MSKKLAGLCAGVAAALAVSVSAALAAGGAGAQAPLMIPPDPGGTTYVLTAARPSSRFVDQLAEARAATAKYAGDLPRAKADGYRIITRMIPNMGYHFMNPQVQGFDVRKPQILVYEHRGATWQLGGPQTKAALTFWHPTLITKHVWLWYPNPSGLFASTNPFAAAFNRG